MTDHPHSTDFRLFLNRFADDDEVTVTVGRSGYGELTVAEMRGILPPTTEVCPCDSCTRLRQAT